MRGLIQVAIRAITRALALTYTCRHSRMRALAHPHTHTLACARKHARAHTCTKLVPCLNSDAIKPA